MSGSRPPTLPGLQTRASAFGKSYAFVAGKIASHTRISVEGSDTVAQTSTPG